MKKILMLLIASLAPISLINAGCGSFWGGFGLGTFSGIVTNEIVHHAHHHRPRKEVIVQPIEYVEIKPTRPGYIEYKAQPISLKEETLITENQRLKRMVNSLENDLEASYSEKHTLSKQIDTLATKINRLDESIEQMNHKLKKTSVSKN